MAGHLKTLTMCALLTWGTGALAQEPPPPPPPPPPAPAAEPQKVPSADAVRDTWNYFYKGQGQGPVLAEAKLCTEVAKDGPNKLECTAELPAEGVKAGTTVMVWQAYLVPQGDSIEDLTVVSRQGSTVRETKDVKVKGEGWRSRQWTWMRLGKAGDWSLLIMRGEKILKQFNVKVQ